MSETAHRAAPTSAKLTIAKTDNEWQVTLNDTPLEMLLAHDGLLIETVEVADGLPGAKVTLVFAPDALDLDIDVDMLAAVAKGGA